MSPVTEVVHLPLVEGSPYPDEDEQSQEGQIYLESVKTIQSQPGCQKIYWGREVENPSKLTMFIDWDELESHRSFESKDIYKPFLDKILKLVSGDALVYHARLDPHPPSPALLDKSKSQQKLATEIISMYFPTSYSSEDQKTVTDNINKILAVIKKEAAGFNGSSGGWVDEEVSIPGSSNPDEKAKLFLGCLGWDSVDAHMKFRETQAFKDNIHLIRGAKDMKSLKMVHVKFQEA